MNADCILYRCNNWQNFKTKIQVLTEKQKGDCFEARAFVRSLGLKSTREWRQYCCGDSPIGEKNPNIPSNPDHVYLSEETLKRVRQVRLLEENNRRLRFSPRKNVRPSSITVMAQPEPLWLLHSTQGCVRKRY